MTKGHKAETSRSALREVSIRSLGVIDSATIEFSPGLTVLTGETGAGKTMVLTALGLISGTKGESSLVRRGAERLQVTASFALPSELEVFYNEVDAEIESGEVLYSRTITSEGRSKVSIGGALTTAAKASELTESLLQVHGQSTNHRLSKAHVQRELLDGFLEDQGALSRYAESFEEYTDLVNRIARLKRESAERDQQIAELKSFITVFNEILPAAGELENIENDISRLGSVEEINETLSEMLNSIDNDDISVLNSLRLARRTGERLRQKDSSLDLILDKFADALFTLEEVMSELLRYSANLDADPKVFEALQQRKAAINGFIKKFGVGSDRKIAYEELLSRGEESKERLADLSGGDSLILELEKELSTKFIIMKKLALSLSAARSSIASDLSHRVSEELHQLAMPNASVLFSVEPQEADDLSSYGVHGIDEVKILFTPHKGAASLPLSKVASGGEMSRVMLGIEVVVAEKSKIGTYIFDEIDSGVGGKAALEIGRRLKKLSQQAQVIVVTHLPQVAVWGEKHLVVLKDESGSVTASSVLSVDGRERVIEIARLLSGQEGSESAQEHAQELLTLASEE